MNVVQYFSPKRVDRVKTLAYNSHTNQGNVTMSLTLRITHNGQTFNVRPKQAQAIELLMQTNGGGFAKINGYVSDSSGEVSNITFISRFSYERLNQRKKQFIEGITMNDIMDEVRDHPKVKALSTVDLYKAFDERKAKLLESIEKTESGDRSDAHRQAHDRNYHQLVPGVKVNFVTEKVKGLEIPVLDKDGFPTVNRIMLSYLQVEKEVLVEGTYKVVNSGVPVILSNAIEKKMPKSCKYKTLSLDEDKFESLSISGKKFDSEWQDLGE
jgi:hypothetical protein